MACFVGLVVMTLIHFQAEEITPNKLTSMAVDIASGLAYLAEMKFVHRYVQCLFYFPTTAWDEDCFVNLKLVCCISAHNSRKLSFLVMHNLFKAGAQKSSFVMSGQKGDEWFHSQETTDSSDLLTLVEWTAMQRCTLVYTLSNHYRENPHKKRQVD